MASLPSGGESLAPHPVLFAPMLLAQAGLPGMIYWLHRLGTVIAAIVPRRVSYWLVSAFVGPALALYRPQYRNALRNMVRLLGAQGGEQDARLLTDRAFVNYGKYMVDLLRLPNLDPRELQRSLLAYGVSSIDEGLARGKGVIVVTGHIGNWDLAGAVLASMGYRVNAIADTLQPERWNDEVQAIRRRLGVNAIPLESGPKDMLRSLRRNEILGILIDRPLHDEGVKCHFFGLPARVPGGAATLALRTGASIVTAVVVRERDHYLAHVGPLITPEPTGNREGEVEVITQQIMTQLEQWIRRYPDQWFMFRDMWPVAGDAAQ